MVVAHSDVTSLLRKHGYTEIRKVGEGSFGKALLVQSQDGSRLICKMVDVSKASRREMEDAVKEGKLLAELRHPYIVRYVDNFTDNGWLCILMDFCEGGDLTAKITEARKARKTIPEDQVLRWFVQGILALKYIHDKHILHRDLKPSNFFLSKNGSMKMGDFGIAKVLACTIAVAKTQIGTPYYLSPELCQEKPYTWPSDIWAMGCILYELCALKVPFDAPNIPGLVKKIVSAPVPPVPSTYSPFIRDLVNEMLNRNPDRRPSPEEILQRPRLQAIVKQMLEEAQEAQAASGSVIAVIPPPAASGSSISSARGEPDAALWKEGDLIEYYSSSHCDWLPAVVMKTDGEGRIIIDLKPNTWISKEDQASRVRERARRISAPDRQPSPAVHRVPSVGAIPAHGGLVPPRAAASPLLGRSPSAGGCFPPVGVPSSRPGSRAGSPQVRRSAAGAAGAAMAGIGSRPGSRVASPLHRAPTPNGSASDSSAGIYRKNDLVEYWSVSHGEWLPATIINTDMHGQVIIDLKPNTWISKEDQASKIRPRGQAGKGGAAGRAPSIGASPQLHRNNSIDRFGAPPGRAASPRSARAASPGRAMSPMGRAASPSWRADSPRRRAYAGGAYAPPDAPTPRRPGMPPAGIVRESPLRAGGRNIAGY